MCVCLFVHACARARVCIHVRVPCVLCVCCVCVSVCDVCVHLFITSAPSLTIHTCKVVLREVGAGPMSVKCSDHKRLSSIFTCCVCDISAVLRGTQHDPHYQVMWPMSVHESMLSCMHIIACIYTYTRIVLLMPTHWDIRTSVMFS